MSKKNYTGVNIQYPISRNIITKKKTIETRTYPIPVKYVNKEMLMIETPGANGEFKARIVAIIKFGPSFKYESKQKFYSDSHNHLVFGDSPWAWDETRGKWGWPIISVKILKKPMPAPLIKGIKFTKNIVL